MKLTKRNTRRIIAEEFGEVLREQAKPKGAEAAARAKAAGGDAKPAAKPVAITDQASGDAFRKWANSTPELAAKYGAKSKFELDPEGKWDNSYIKKAFATAKEEYAKSLASATPEGPSPETKADAADIYSLLRKISARMKRMMKIITGEVEFDPENPDATTTSAFKQMVAKLTGGMVKEDYVRDPDFIFEFMMKSGLSENESISLLEQTLGPKLQAKKIVLDQVKPMFKELDILTRRYRNPKGSRSLAWAIHLHNKEKGGKDFEGSLAALAAMAHTLGVAAGLEKTASPLKDLADMTLTSAQEKEAGFQKAMLDKGLADVDTTVKISQALGKERGKAREEKASSDAATKVRLALKSKFESYARKLVRKGNIDGMNWDEDEIKKIMDDVYDYAKKKGNPKGTRKIFDAAIKSETEFSSFYSIYREDSGDSDVKAAYKDYKRLTP
jgi:hypothetical protein